MASFLKLIFLAAVLNLRSILGVSTAAVAASDLRSLRDGGAAHWHARAAARTPHDRPIAARPHVSYLPCWQAAMAARC